MTTRNRMWAIAPSLLITMCSTVLLFAPRATARARVEKVPAPPKALHMSATVMAARAIHVPRVATPIAIDAEMAGKRVWDSEAGSTGNLHDADGRGMVPYSEMRARWGDGALYLWL